ncbi:MAG: poly-beta-1,6-N-acetyl-D-glucosamine biosynthesis protein PgaD [Methylococcus sp.]|nr:MAG: poly-beta-1,6-N-acetyl-D-glucosamine biosynthesis protein PgaD [Methylococcus sp.]
MKQDDLIIEMPHLQSFGQRLGSLFVAIACWSLWGYFLIPLVSLSGWLMGVRKFSAEVRWFGGYKSLIELLEIYGMTILGILIAWMIWTLGTSITRQRSKQDKPKKENRYLDQDFMTDTVNLESSKALKTVTVWFDDQGLMTDTKVTALKPGADALIQKAPISP